MWSSQDYHLVSSHLIMRILFVIYMPLCHIHVHTCWGGYGIASTGNSEIYKYSTPKNTLSSLDMPTTELLTSGVGT